MLKKIGSFVLLIAIAFFIYFLVSYISYRTKNAVSNAAFVKSDSLYTLSFKVGGKIKNIYVKEGDKVAKNKLLAQKAIKAIYEAKEFKLCDIEELKELSWNDSDIYDAIDHASFLFKNARIIQSYSL